MSITIQSAYATNYAEGFPGMIADSNTQARPSGTVEDAGGISFGKACFSGTNIRGITGTPGTKFKGIAITDAGVVPAPGGAVDTYPQYSNISMLDQGDIWVLAGATVAKDAAAYVTSAGAFTSVSSGNTAIPATFMEAASSGSPVKLRVVQQ